MGRLDLIERHSETRCVTKEYLEELYDEIAQLRAEKRVLLEQNDALLSDFEMKVIRDAAAGLDRHARAA